MSDKFPVMLISPPRELDKRINFPAMAQVKMDGMRAIVIKRDGEVTVFSRNGKKMIKLNHHFGGILEEMDNVMLDGELTVLDDKGEVMDRQTGNGICHKAVDSVATISDEEVKQIRLTLWDIIDIKEFDLKKSIRGGMDRLESLKKMRKHSLFSIVETWIVKDKAEAQGLFMDLVSRGEEGLILKNKDHLWEPKRSLQCVKMKEEIDVDFKIIGFAEGTGKASGMLGAIQTQNKDGSIKVDVGTGFSDAQRIDIWSKQEQLLNTIIAIKHNGVITRKGTDTKSLYLPRFIELRPDKDEVDM
jgi:DNA ligase-1